MTEDKEIYQLRTVIELTRKEILDDFGKNERLSKLETSLFDLFQSQV